jgi:hypothetical protein
LAETGYAMIKMSARLLALLPAIWLASSMPARSAGPALAMLDQLERGSWELRYRGAERRVERLCVTDGRRLIQLRHPGPACQRVVIEDGAASVTVQYTCPGRGYGRTQIKRETNRLVQVTSQGIVDGLPYEDVAEARRVGDCAS